MIDADAPLPPEFRQRLFASPSGVELDWPGKHLAGTTSDAAAPRLDVVERYGDAVDGWRNRLILGDNTDVLQALANGPLRDEIEARGGLRLIYIDPPFLTGRTFAVEVPIGEGRSGVQRTVSLPAYNDGASGGLAGYLDAMLVRLRLMYDLLAEDGTLYFHCDHRVSAAMRLLLDEIFGADRLLNEIVWYYGLGNPGGKRAFARKHDTILVYTKSARYTFNRLRGEITPAMTSKYRHEDEHGRYLLSYGKKYYLKGGKPLDSVWSIPTLGATDGQRNGYPTQKPEALLERILLASSNPGDLVADFCCGSGTLAAVAARVGRRWMACDAVPRAIQTTRARLLGAGVSGFELLELAGYSRPLQPVVYDARVTATAAACDNRLIVRLTGFCPAAGEHSGKRGGLAMLDGHLVRVRRPREDAAGLVIEPLTEQWTDWIESWAVATTSAPFSPIWWGGRWDGQRILPLASPPIDLAGSSPDRVFVKVVDILGGETVSEIVGI
jgi:DNA modification methylase